MSQQNPAPGTITWQDLTVPDAERVRDFYRAVVGWKYRPEDIGGYNDFVMMAPGSDQPVAGVCHSRGINADLPPQWLVYINVADVDQSAKICMVQGGSVMVGPRDMGGGRFCVIRDPAGAVCALFAPPRG